MCSWIDGIASANTCRLRLPKPSNVEPLRLGSCPILVFILIFIYLFQYSKLLHTAPVWTSALNNHAIQKKLFSTQRGVVLRIVSAYRIVSTSAVLVLAIVPPIDLLSEERKETFQLHKELTCLTNLQKIAHPKEAIRKDEMRRLVEMGVPVERMTEESYATLNWNQPPAKFKG